MNNSYLLQLELNKKNHMIFLIYHNKEDYNEVIGFMVLEDKRRPGTLEDFDYLKSCYECDEWDDFRNLITIKIYTFTKLSDIEYENLRLLADTFIEFKPSVNHRVDFIVNSTLLKLYEKCREDVSNMDMTPLYKELLDLGSENTIDLSDLNINSYNHLSQ